MKRLFKRAPSKDYVSDYEPSIGLIEQIAKDTREPYNTVHPALSANDVLLRLLEGETVRVINPFAAEIEWTLEEPKGEVKSGFIEWYDRYNEARAAKGLNAPADRDRAGNAFRDKRDPEDLAMDDLMDAGRYTVEKQQDGTWAIFNGGGFCQGGYPDRGEAVFEAKQRIAADIECGVPVIKEVAPA